MKVVSNHILPEGVQLEKILKTDLGNVFIYKNFVVTEFKEGSSVSYKTAFSILLLGLNVLKFRPWFYISNRIHSYAVKPTDYKYLNSVPTLKGMAIVTYTEAARINLELESKFCKKPFQSFESLAEAYEWGMTLMKKQ